MLRNLATNLITHERIHTTLAKAKEMRPLIERLIHHAKRNDEQSQIFMKKTLFTQAAIDKLKETIAPRFKDLPAGFTRVEFLGPRKVDKGKAAMIEILKNPYSEFERNEELVECERGNGEGEGREEKSGKSDLAAVRRIEPRESSIVEGGSIQSSTGMQMGITPSRG
jgi:large subunit ribosomal protein L17